MNDPNIRCAIDEDGVLTASFDTPGRPVNVFSPAMMNSLEHLIETVESTRAIQAVVLSSGKATFIAGADLGMVRWFTDAARTESTAHLHEVCGRLGRLFRRLEQSSKPYVAAINGLALGGGLELALACHGRVSVDDPAVQLGLPEIKLGLLPGAGGTQRLPRVIGTAPAMQMLLTGEPLTSRQALALKLVDALTQPSELIGESKRHARALLSSSVRAPWDRSVTFSAGPFDFSQSDAAAEIFRAVGITAEQLAHYPSYNAIAKSVAGGWYKPFDAALHWEMDCFIELIRNPVAGNMVRALFLDKQRAAKLGLLSPDSEFSRGATALLPRLRKAKQQASERGCSQQETLLAVALVAIEVWSDGVIAETALADAAVVAEGVVPAYTGGPYTFAKQCGADELRARARAAQMPLPRGFERFVIEHQDAIA
jgi:enoyl-CoA hydratase/carnithine racemase